MIKVRKSRACSIVDRFTILDVYPKLPKQILAFFLVECWFLESANRYGPAIADKHKGRWKRIHHACRILRMNKRLEHETRGKLFEKRGWYWALTGFAFEVWGETEKDF